MTNRAAKVTPDAPLYASEDQIAVFVIGPARAKEWPGIVAALERQGFPPINKVFGGRYRPAVKAWLDAFEAARRMAEKRKANRA